MANSNLSDQTKEVILASLLGDGCITPHKKGHHLSIKHSIKQREYLEWKISLMPDLMPGKIHTFISWTDEGVPVPMCSSSSINHPFLTNLRTQWYLNNTKSILLNNINDLGLLGLAIWYMDDGRLQRECRICDLATHSFTKEENVILQGFIKDKFDLDSKVSKHYSSKNNRTYYFLYFNVKNSLKLIDLVFPYVNQVSSMKYKIAPQRLKAGPRKGEDIV